MIGKCKQRGVVYETICVQCEKKREGEIEERKKIESKTSERDSQRREVTGVKRKRIIVGENRDEEERKKESIKKVRYIGESSRSGYERGKEHWNAFINCTG